MEIPFLNHWIIFSLIGLLACLYILVTFNPLAERINGHISQLPICALKNITPVLEEKGSLGFFERLSSQKKEEELKVA